MNWFKFFEVSALKSRQKFKHSANMGFIVKNIALQESLRKKPVELGNLQNTDEEDDFMNFRKKAGQNFVPK